MEYQLCENDSKTLVLKKIEKTMEDAEKMSSILLSYLDKLNAAMHEYNTAHTSGR